jgi:CheY-like chemotaxis protein
MDGLDTLRALRRLDLSRSTPAVLVTADADPADPGLHRQLGVIALIAKPFDPSTFAETIHGLWLACGSPRATADGDMRALQANYLVRLANYARLLQEAREHVERSRYSSGSVASMAELVHKLSGSAGSYGYPDVSRDAVRVSDGLQSMLSRKGAADPREVMDDVESLARSLAAALSRPGAHGPRLEPRGES